jgi:hypothetical protein
MNCQRHSLLLAALVLSMSSHVVLAQTSADPSGHWEGAVQAMDTEIKVQVDILKNASGALVGSYTNPSRNIQGLPLKTVTVQGQTVTFSPTDSVKFIGQLSADGQSMKGDFTGTDATGTDFSVPFSLVRTGVGRAAAPPAAAVASKVGKELEGAWTGLLEVEGETMRLVLTIARQASGAATGTIANADRGGVQAPVSSMTHKGSQVVLEIKAVNASYTGVLNADATEITGTYTQGPLTVPLSFKRGAAAAAKQD